MANPTEKEITNRAYKIWEENGKPEGRDKEFWEQAEKELTEGISPDEKSDTFLE